MSIHPLLSKVFGKLFQIEILFHKQNVISCVISHECAVAFGPDKLDFDRLGKFVVGIDPVQLLISLDLPAGNDIKEIFPVQTA